MTRRLQHYDVAEWRPWLLVAEGGVAIILLGIIAQIAQIVVSVRTREQRRDATGDPWDGRNLEWATASPPPSFNFAVLPDVTDQEPYWDMKARARETGQLTRPEPQYEPIHMPRNSPTGFVTAFFSVVTGFALIWHIWWLVLLGLAGAYATFVVFAWRDHDEILIPADEVARHNLLWSEIFLALTGLLGLVFIGLEVHEFVGLVARGAGPTRSAFLTSFFALVGCHGAHVSAGLLWLGTMMAQFPAKGFKESIRHRYLCFSLFWHALDIIWIGIFTVVYLIGMISS